MGEAKRRGTYEQRVEQAKKRIAEQEALLQKFWGGKYYVQRSKLTSKQLVAAAIIAGLTPTPK
jgi:hypothetical protein